MKTLKSIKVLQKLLTKIHNKTIYVDGGLCANYYDMVRTYNYTPIQFRDQYYYSIIKWEHYSYNVTYPIPVTDKQYNSPVEQFNQGNKWKGRQLELRIDLLEFIISELKKELNG